MLDSVELLCSRGPTFSIQSLSMRQLPSGFSEMIKSVCGVYADTLLTALSDSEPSLAVRVNRLKGMEKPDGFIPVPWLSDRAFYLSDRPVFAADPAWHQGLYYVQDASSMVLTRIVESLSREYFGNIPLRYLDACAAPGGKTIAAIEGLPSGSVVLANEYDRRRASALVENVAKYGYPDVAISCCDAASLGKLGPVFDIVAVDAPCSGEGMMRKEPEAVRQWNVGLVESCAAMQRDILRGIWNALRPGGFLVYSTCTFNRVEDEDNVAFLIDELGAESIPLPLESIEGIVGDVTGRSIRCCRFLPGYVRGEGLFVSVVRKPEGSASQPKMNLSVVNAPLAADFVRRHVADADRYKIITTGKDEYSVVPTENAAFFAYMHRNLHLLRCGAPVCTIKGRDTIPAWELAFSTALKRGSFPELALDRAAAMTYLHGESLAGFDSELPKGFVLCTYNGMPLGFVKNIGRRANNLYPDAMRLRMNVDSFQSIDVSLVKYPV